MGGYMGLSLAMHDTNAQSFVDKGAKNFFSITVTDATTITSGYIQPFYASMTTSGSITTTSSQICPFAADVFLGGTISAQVAGMYVYEAASGTPVLDNSNISGIVVYLDDLGDTPGTRCGIQLCIADAHPASYDGFIYCRIEGSGSVTNLIEKGGTATNPTYLLKTNAVDGMVSIGVVEGNVAAAAGWLRTLIGGTQYWIALHASCAD